MNITNVGEWAQFGLGGLVIAALFALLWKIVHGALGRFDTVMSEHRKERDEWRRSSEQRDDKLERALHELSRSLSPRNSK